MPADELADLLETLATSDFNYAAYIKEISFDVLWNNDVTWTRTQDKVASQLKFDTGCGRFFSTLLLAALKKVVALETFRWDVKVHLTPSIFATLGKFSSLQDLYVRMHIGPSISGANNSNFGQSWVPAPVPVPQQQPPPTIVGSAHPHPHGPPPSTTLPVVTTRRAPRSRLPIWDGTFSHIQKLKSLAILDMECLGYLNEIACCVSASSTTLKTLKLSFSERLAAKAQKKAVVENSDTESDTQDDDIYEPDDAAPPPPPATVFPSIIPTTSTSNPNNDAKVRNERLMQEKTLSRIFSLENEASMHKLVHKIVYSSNAAAHDQKLVADKTTNSPDKTFMFELHGIVTDLHLGKATLTPGLNAMKTVERVQNATSKFLKTWGDSQLSQKLSAFQIELLEKHALSLEKKGSIAFAAEPSPTDVTLAKDFGLTAQSSDIDPDEQNSSNSDNPVSQETTSASASAHLIEQPNSSEVATRGFTFSIPAKNENELERRMMAIVDMEHPDNLSEGEDQEFLDPREIAVQRNDRAPEDVNGWPGSTEERDLQSSIKGKEPIRGPHESPANAKFDSSREFGTMSTEQAIQEYIRLNHGIALESLSIQLIPLKTSVICRAINIWSLKHISLLNVGPQRAFWATLMQLNKSNPLQISSIHSDNVTLQLLAFIGSLDFVDELFLIERKASPVSDPPAPKPPIRISHIYSLALETHMKHLKRLMIRNDVDSSWNLDRWNTRCITTNGSNLVELVVAVDSAHFVSEICQIVPNSH
ncbi:predicted protein [Uncinocarpus reesii 1704]|uniref:F-box domain-containing protein n=1 Tax=Uncinocarpus reesii (strain UAMH 1704) TaxID=336963 RepID=C4JYA1_UNCRE|nr:uncharacterized protein UREG_07152 [Uncinocarpus reesii 1704]EEP82287.1 predicted protein [Uncinocarpus reesii 1704]